MWLFAIFLSVPLIEIALFIQVGGLIGLWPTLGIVIVTALLGTWLVREQGRMAMGELRKSFSELQDPSLPLAHGAMILVSGVLLLTPGFFTDAVGFALLVPQIREAVFHWVRKRVHVSRFEMGAGMGPGDQNSDPRTKRPRSGDVIDGEFTEVPQDQVPKQSGSGWTRQ